MKRPCAECKALLPVAQTWPWIDGRICLPCLAELDYPNPQPPPPGPGACSYCGADRDVQQCCPDHPDSLICLLCRQAPGRTKNHRSPLEGRACCGTTKDSNPDCDICGRGQQRRKAKK